MAQAKPSHEYKARWPQAGLNDSEFAPTNLDHDSKLLKLQDTGVREIIVVRDPLTSQGFGAWMSPSHMNSYGLGTYMTPNPMIS
jgi:hypothetical protein